MTPDYWPVAKAHLAKKDRVLRKLIKAYPNAEIQSRGDAFQSLARAIVGQQISVKAAQSVWRRFAEAAGNVDPATVVRMETDALRGCGFSGQKATYVRDLARHFPDLAATPYGFQGIEQLRVVEDV